MLYNDGEFQIGVSNFGKKNQRRNHQAIAFSTPPKQIPDESKLNKTEKQVLEIIEVRAVPNHGDTKIFSDRMAKVVGISVRQISRILNKLEKLGFITRYTHLYNNRQKFASVRYFRAWRVVFMFGCQPKFQPNFDASHRPKTDRKRIKSMLSDIRFYKKARPKRKMFKIIGGRWPNGFSMGVGDYETYLPEAEPVTFDAAAAFRMGVFDFIMERFYKWQYLANQEAREGWAVFGYNDRQRWVSELLKARKEKAAQLDA